MWKSCLLFCKRWRYEKLRRKYGNKKITVDGMTFDSKKEYMRWCELKLLERARAISELRRQVEYELLPAQKIGGKVAERAVKYIADFVYVENGERIVEDTKGVRTADYILKRKLMLYLHGIRIREI